MPYIPTSELTRERPYFIRHNRVVTQVRSDLVDKTVERPETEAEALACEKAPSLQQCLIFGHLHAKILIQSVLQGSQLLVDDRVHLCRVYV